MGLSVEQGLGNELIGMIPRSKVACLKTDADVKTVEVSGE
jgi:hypothetical protein